MMASDTSPIPPDMDPVTLVNPMLERAELARQYIEAPIVKLALKEMREIFFQQFVGSAPENTDIRQRAYDNTRHLNMFENILNGYIQRAAGVQDEVELP